MCNITKIEKKEEGIEEYICISQKNEFGIKANCILLRGTQS